MRKDKISRNIYTIKQRLFRNTKNQIQQQQLNIIKHQCSEKSLLYLQKQLIKS